MWVAVGWLVVAALVALFIYGVLHSPAARQLSGGPIGVDGLTNKERSQLAGLDRLAALGCPLSPAQQRKRSVLRAKLAK